MSLNDNSNQTLNSASTSPSVQQASSNNISSPHRITAHSHIKGLGLDSSGNVATSTNSGLIGQIKARQACGLLVDLIRNKKLSGRALLFSGNVSTGKSALAYAISLELGTKIPFCKFNGSEVNSMEVKKTEILKQHFRKAIGLKIKEVKDVYEGEIIDLNPIETVDSLSGYGKSISHVVVVLKSTKGTKSLKLDPTIYENILKEKARIGDIIYIESKSGNVKVGRCDAYASEYDLEAEEYAPLPKTEVFKKKEIIHNVTLHDLDMSNAKPQGGKDLVSIVSKLMKPKQSEITDKLRLEINKIVNNYIEENVAELVPGVLFIDEAHMLDIECFTYLNRALESSLSPIVVLATNRGIGTKDIISPHGIPLDLLDRMIIIHLQEYSETEMYEILKLRVKTENVQIDSEALNKLSQIAASKSLRYVLQLLTPLKMLAKMNNNGNMSDNIRVGLKEVESATQLFLDSKQSAQVNQGSINEYMS